MNDNLGNPEMITELFDLKGSLADAVKNMRQYGIQAAKANAKYRMEKANKIHDLKEQGYPATLILDLAKGELADLLYERDRLEVIYDSQKEFINQLKLQIKVLESQIDREWRG